MHLFHFSWYQFHSNLSEVHHFLTPIMVVVGVWWLLLLLVVVVSLLIKVMVLFCCRCMFDVYSYQETKDNFRRLICLRRCLSLLNLTSWYPATYLLSHYLLNFYLHFSFCISFNGFLGSAVSGVLIATGFSADFDESNDFISFLLGVHHVVENVLRF